MSHLKQKAKEREKKKSYLAFGAVRNVKHVKLCQQTQSSLHFQGVYFCGLFSA